MNEPKDFLEFARAHLLGEHSGAYLAGAWDTLVSRLNQSHVLPITPAQYALSISDMDAWRSGANKADYIWHQWQLLLKKEHGERRDENAHCEEYCPQCGKPY